MTLKQWLQPVKTDQATQETHGKRFTNITITLKKMIATYLNTYQATQETLYKHDRLQSLTIIRGRRGVTKN